MFHGLRDCAHEIRTTCILTLKGESDGRKSGGVGTVQLGLHFFLGGFAKSSVFLSVPWDQSSCAKGLLQSSLATWPVT